MKKADCCPTLHCQKAGLAYTAKTTADGHLACTFCACIGNNSPEQQIYVFFLCNFVKNKLCPSMLTTAVGLLVKNNNTFRREARGQFNVVTGLPPAFYSSLFSGKACTNHLLAVAQESIAYFQQVHPVLKHPQGGCAYQMLIGKLQKLSNTGRLTQDASERFVLRQRFQTWSTIQHAVFMK